MKRINGLGTFDVSYSAARAAFTLTQRASREVGAFPDGSGDEVSSPETSSAWREACEKIQDGMRRLGVSRCEVYAAHRRCPDWQIGEVEIYPED